MYRYALALLTLTLPAAVLPPNQPALMPWPLSYRPGVGALPLTPGFSVTVSPRDNTLLQQAAQRLTQQMMQETGLMFGTGAAGSPGLAVRCGKASRDVQVYGEDESYTLLVKPTGAVLTAPTSLGVLRGFATLAQLVTRTPSGYSLPAAEIEDTPRFGWRGLHIDVSRHFFPVDQIKRNLDGMAAVKLNVFHWHLSDNQGFRVESKLYPKLQQLGSDGLFYTQDQIRDVVAYAHDRGIRVLPEFDIPGHSTAWLVGYPELAAGPGPFEIGRTWGIFDPAMDPTSEKVYTFLDAFIGEMAALFPDDYFHIGGDEVNGRQWNANDRITQFKRDQGYLTAANPTKAQQTAANEKLQAYFNRRLEPLVRKHGKKMMGWDEILAPDLTKGIVIQSWRGPKSLGDAVQQGYDGVLSSGYYLDLMQPARQHYLVDPMPPGIGADAARHVLGGEACMWSEYVSPETVESRIWPRTAAIAERFWSPAALRDVESMYARLEAVSRKLDLLGLTHNSNYAPMLARLAPGADLRTLADVVEPVKGYARSSSGIHYTQQTPLNRLVDASRPESDLARHFAMDVSARNWPAVRTRLTAWKNYQLPAASMPQEALQEAMPVARNLNALAAIGLEALGLIEQSKPVGTAWGASKMSELATLRKSHAELLLSPADGVALLIKEALMKPAQ